MFSTPQDNPSSTSPASHNASELLTTSRRDQAQQRLEQCLKATLQGIALNFCLAIIKGAAGFFGHSYALIADALESLSDIFTSLVVFAGLKMAGKPADKNHPYGHGKFEPLAASLVAVILIAAAGLMAVASINEIVTPHHAPAPFTLAVLAAVVLFKELLFRRAYSISENTLSSAVKADAWHHRSDAITSGAAFIGISVALIGGEGYESADDFAALVAALVITINGILILRSSLYELIDTAPDPAIAQQIREIATTVADVLGTHKCQVRKLGFDYYVDLDVLCDPSLNIRQGHEIAHNVGEAIHRALPYITKVLVHIEPIDDFGRRNR